MDEISKPTRQNAFRWWRPKKRVERRHGKDVLLRILTIIGYINTAVIVTAAILLSKAEPDTFHSMTRHLPLRSYWDPVSLKYLFALCVFGFFLSLAGLIVNMRRLKRKYDSVRYNLIVVAILSMAGIIAYLNFS